MIFEIFRSHFSVGSPMMDDTEYIIIGSMRTLELGDGNGFGKLPGVIPA